MPHPPLSYLLSNKQNIILSDLCNPSSTKYPLESWLSATNAANLSNHRNTLFGPSAASTFAGLSGFKVNSSSSSNTYPSYLLPNSTTGILNPLLFLTSARSSHDQAHHHHHHHHQQQHHHHPQLSESFTLLNGLTSDLQAISSINSHNNLVGGSINVENTTNRQNCADTKASPATSPLNLSINGNDEQNDCSNLDNYRRINGLISTEDALIMQNLDTNLMDTRSSSIAALRMKAKEHIECLNKGLMIS